MRLLLGILLLWSTLAHAGERCGPNNCSDDEVCCNYGCGGCVPKDGPEACDLLLCLWGAPDEIVPGDLPNPDVYARESMSFGDFDGEPGGRALVQRYVGDDAALRLVGGATPDGAMAGAGLTLGLSIWDPTRSAIVVDAFVDPRGLHAAAGLAASGNSFWFAHARWEHAIDADGKITGGLDVGGGLTYGRPYIVPCGSGCTRALPAAISVGYRYRRDLVGDDAQAHEIDAGLYWLGRRLHIGVETELWSSVAVLLRVDFYDEAGR